MALLDRKAIFGATDIKTQDVEVPEWGGSVRVRQMTVAERNEFVRRSSDDQVSGIGTWLVATLAVDDKGAPLFTSEDIAELEKKNFRNLDLVAKAIMQVNGLGEKEVEEAAKNSTPIPS